MRENGFLSVAANPFSTFSADVDTASYCNLRRMLSSGTKLNDIPKGAVRIEEMLNYFRYDYRAPKDAEPFGVTPCISTCPWNPDTKLLVLGLSTEPKEYAQTHGNNLVFSHRQFGIYGRSREDAATQGIHGRARRQPQR